MPKSTPTKLTVRVGEVYPVAAFEPCPDKHLARVKPTGEFRPPKTGEWYLSGAYPEGYLACANLSSPYHIGVLVYGVLVWRERPHA